MLKQQRVQYIHQRLQELYPAPPIPLDHKDSYTLLVAVLLSAQCTDERVNTVTPALFQLADNAHDMAPQSVDTIRGPFLVAGAAQGVIASVLALVLLEGVRRAVLSYSGTGARVLIDLFAAHPLPRGLAVVLLVVGLLVSMAGSYFAVRESV